MRALWLRWRSDPLRWSLWAIAVGTFLSGLLLIGMASLWVYENMGQR